MGDENRCESREGCRWLTDSACWCSGRTPCPCLKNHFACWLGGSFNNFSTIYIGDSPRGFTHLGNAQKKPANTGI
jgi:hypothetical protein